MATAPGPLHDPVPGRHRADHRRVLADAASPDPAGAGQRVPLPRPARGRDPAARRAGPAAPGAHADRLQCLADGRLAERVEGRPAAADLGAGQPAGDRAGLLGDVPLPLLKGRDGVRPPLLHGGPGLAGPGGMRLHRAVQARLEWLPRVGMVACPAAQQGFVQCRHGRGHVGDIVFSAIYAAVVGPPVAALTRDLPAAGPAGRGRGHHRRGGHDRRGSRHPPGRPQGHR